tara:strand:+ start:287 stop:706 length:420 start_codon:yes stop_codon:yes gene_type:complete
MANLKISQLPAVTEANATAVLPIVQSGVTSKILVTDLTNEYIRKAEHVISTVTTSQTINLSTTKSVNIIIVDNPGLTLTIQFPTSPVESQICQFTILTNTVTIVAGSGTFNPVYSGAPTAGFSCTYVYHDVTGEWYKIS